MGRDKVPELGDGTVYADWKKRVAIWQLSTSIEAKKQAATLITYMTGKPEQAAIQLNVDELKKDTGVEALMKEMDKLFEPDTTQQVFNALDEFLGYRRPTNTSMEDYCREFTRMLRMAEQKSGKKPGELFDDGVLGYFLLKNSNLEASHITLVRATVTQLTFGLVRQL